MKQSIVALVFAAIVIGAAPLSAQQQPVPAGVSSQPSSEAIAKAKLDGTIAATNVGGWFGRSVVIGALTGLIGTGVTYAVAANSSPELPPEKQLQISKESAEYRVIFEKAYADKVRSKRKSTALTGGLVGTAAFVVLLISSSGS